MRRWLSTVIALGLVLVGISPASAADEIGLSLDGTHWVDTLEDPLLDPGVTWVPGDSTTVSFYVRNQADTAAVLSAAVLTDDGDRLLSDRHVSLRARAGGRWFPLVNGHDSPALTAASISPDGKVRVDVEAAFDPASSNASQSAALDLMLRVRLADAVEDMNPVPVDPTPTDGSEKPNDADEERDAPPAGTDHLPRTGSDTPAILIWTALLAMTAGAAFVAAGRREREDDDA